MSEKKTTLTTALYEKKPTERDSCVYLFIPTERNVGWGAIINFEKFLIVGDENNNGSKLVYHTTTHKVYEVN